MRTPRGGDVRAHRVGGEEVDVAVAAGGQHDRVAEVGLDLAGDHVAHDDALGTGHAVGVLSRDQLEHLVTGVRGDGASGDLTLQGLVGTDQQLLTGLATGVERAGDLHAAERAVVEQAAVLASERDAWATHWSMMLAETSARR